jgi:hypothetical protein
MSAATDISRGAAVKSGPCQDSTARTNSNPYLMSAMLYKYQEEQTLIISESTVSKIIGYQAKDTDYAH